jgi:cation diffusion facilitator CzcD-associated flavoprotein CzcO
MAFYEKDVIVVGAGLSGLASAHVLVRCGIDVQVLEGRERVAEPWRARHPALRLNTHRKLSGLPGLLLPTETGSFPARDDVVSYLEAYADQLAPAIAFGVMVREIDQIPGGWLVDTSTGPWVARHVVIATGHDAVPWTPSWPGRETFKGELIHAAAFGAAEQFAGRDVLVVGAGNSGSDVLNQFVKVGPRRLWVSIRHGPAVFPTWLFGLPVQLLSPVFELLPAKAADHLLRLTQRLAFGDLAKHGLKSHPAGGASRLLADGTAPAIDAGFVAALKRGDIKVVGEIAAFDGRRVQLVDGAKLEPEVVIAATGYRTGLERLVGHLGVLDARGVPRTNGALRDANNPGLWFTGMRPRLSGFFRAAARDGTAIAGAVKQDLRSRAPSPLRNVENVLSNTASA